VCYVTLTGTAYIHGIKHATGNFIILMDADLSHHVCVCSFEYRGGYNSWISWNLILLLEILEISWNSVDAPEKLCN